MKTKNMVLVILSIIVFLFIIISWNNASAISSSPQTQSSMLYVKPGGTGTCEGSWGNACADLQTALSAAVPGNQIWVAAGTYKPTIDTNREATFQLKSGVTIYGGFAGTETLLEDRDWETNITTLSGDLNGDDGDAPANNLENSYHVVTGSEVNNTAVLDGFIISGGNANGTHPDDKGGGMYNYIGNPTLTNVTFNNNSSFSGGGMYNENSDPILTNVSFSANSAVYGGGMYDKYTYSNLTNVTFSGNTAQDGGGMYIKESVSSLSNVTFSNNVADQGGGLYNGKSDSTLTNVTFSRNTANNSGGGMYNAFFCSPTLINISFIHNSADNGGGMHNESSSNPTLTNATFSGNTARFSGGGMYNETSSSPTLTNVTFSGNTASDSGGGMYNEDSSNPTLVNAILWGNNPDQIYNIDSTSYITYSIIDDESYSDPTNIFTDPLLGPLADNGGFTFTHALHTGSPAIDTGNPDPTICPATDQRGFPRPLDGDGNGIATCDIGAYEYMDYGPVMFAKLGASGDCSSWSSACELRQALSIASPGVQIWAAAGTYKPTTSDPDPRKATFQLKSGVAIYGGFAGTETSLQERDWENNITILSGDIGTVDVDTDNSFHVVTGSEVDATAVLDGFTITGGANQGDITPTNQGGGMYIDCGKPILRNIVFYNNTASYGGGLYSRCESNKENAPTLTNVVFDQNTVVYEGGGIYTSRNNLELTNITFSNNKAGKGGGMINYQSNPSLTNVTFFGNEAQYLGGAMANYDSNPILINVTFSGNKANGTSYGGGGGMYNDESSPRLTNITFTLNEAIINGSAMYNTGEFDDSNPVITNAIIWGNIGGQIVDSGGNNYAIVNYSVIEGGYTGFSGIGNIDEDPHLGELADNGGLTLTHALLAGSPAIDTGNSDLSICPTTDQRGYTRPIGAGCDIGAYEYGYTLTVQKEGSGSVFIDPLKPEYNLNELAMLTATADPGWTFTGWSGDASGTDNPLTITIDDSKNITANFSPIEYTLVVAVEPLDSGTVTVDPTQVTYHYGDDITLTPTANTGWSFTGWDGDAFGTDNPLTVTIKGDTTVTANFTQDEYTLTVEANPTEGGTVSTDSEQTIFHYGDEVNLTATPNDGWTFDSWSGAEVAENVVTIKGDTIVTAHFLKDEQESHNVYLPLILR